MPIHNYPPPEYIEISTLPEFFGMSKQNLYQSGLMTWVQDRYDIYTVGRSQLINYRHAHEVQLYLTWRQSKIKFGSFSTNTPLVSEENFDLFLEWNNDDDNEVI